MVRWKKSNRLGLATTQGCKLATIKNLETQLKNGYNKQGETQKSFKERTDNNYLMILIL